MSRIDRDLRRFQEIGESNRMDLEEFIQHGQLGEDIQIPIKVIDLPSFEYDRQQMGGVGKGDGEQGDPVQADPDEEGKAGGHGGEHEYYDMDPEEFARELDDELGLEFDDKGSKVVEVADGDYNETRRAGPKSMLDTDYLFKQAIKRHVAMFADTDYLKEMLRVQGYDADRVWEWARTNNVNVSKAEVESLASEITNHDEYESPEAIPTELSRQPPRASYSGLKFRSDDEQYRAAETVEKPEHNAVVFNVRDVSGSMRKTKRELVERVFTPIDWYLQGKYDNVEFVYIVHDSNAWQVNRDEFFGIKSGGGTQVSSAYQLIDTDILSRYPWSKWNRYFFAAGDGENQENDTKQNLIPLLEQIEANRHAYVQVQPNDHNPHANLADVLDDHFRGDDTYRISHVGDKSDILGAITDILDQTAHE